MKFRLLSLCIGCALVLPAATAPKRRTTRSSDMQRAIAWEHYKDMAAARQARREARHPSVSYGEANREETRPYTNGRRVTDPGPPAWHKDHPEFQK